MFCLHNNMHFASICLHLPQIEEVTDAYFSKRMCQWKLEWEAKYRSINGLQHCSLELTNTFCLPLSWKKQHICVSFSNSCGLIQRWLIGSTYRFLLSTLMVDQPPIEKEQWNHWKGRDESFRICNPSNWSSWHLLLTNRDAMHSLLIPPFSIIFTHSYRAVLSLQFFASCVAWDPSFQEVDAWQGTWKAFALDFFPSILLTSRKYHCVVLSLSFSASSCVMILHFRSKVYAWQGTWKHDFKCFSHEYIYIKICKNFKCIYSWTFA